MAYPSYIVINLAPQVPAVPPGQQFGPTVPPHPWRAQQNLPPGRQFGPTVPPQPWRAQQNLPPGRQFGPTVPPQPWRAQQNLPPGPPFFGSPLYQQTRGAQQNLPPGPPSFGPLLYPETWGAQQNLPPPMGPQFQPCWSSNAEQFQSPQATFNRQPPNPTTWQRQHQARRQGPGPHRRRRPNPRQRRRRQEERQHQENVSIGLQENGRIQRERRYHSSSRWRPANESRRHHAVPVPSRPEPSRSDVSDEYIEVLETFPPSGRGEQNVSQWPAIIRGAARRRLELSDADRRT